MTSPASLTPERLTEALRAAAALTRGRVEEVTTRSSRPTVISNVGVLGLSYSADAQGPRPATLFFKTRKDGVEAALAAAGRREVEFYSAAAPPMPEGLLPRCYLAEVDEQSDDWILVLEDLSSTHSIVTPWPLPPTDLQCEAIIDVRARFHAFWWDHPRLGQSVGTFFDEPALQDYVRRSERRFAMFADMLGDRLSGQRRRIYERVITSGAPLMRRSSSRKHLTLVQGDAHVWNLMYPNDPAADGIRLMDWDSWRIDIGAEDIAYMIAVHWYPERRRRLERPLLERYQARLGEHGVTGYGMEALWEDYRLSVLWQLLLPVWQNYLKLGAWIWWGHLERTLLAFDDLGCAELLN